MIQVQFLAEVFSALSWQELTHFAQLGRATAFGAVIVGSNPTVTTVALRTCAEIYKMK